MVFFTRVVCRYTVPVAGVREQDRQEPVRLAVVACGTRLEETLTMLKSAILFSCRTLHFYIFAEDELHAGFRQAVSVILVIYLHVEVHVSDISSLYSWSRGRRNSAPSLTTARIPSPFPARTPESGENFSNRALHKDSFFL